MIRSFWRKLRPRRWTTPRAGAWLQSTSAPSRNSKMGWPRNSLRSWNASACRFPTNRPALRRGTPHRPGPAGRLAGRACSTASRPPLPPSMPPSEHAAAQHAAAPAPAGNCHCAGHRHWRERHSPSGPRAQRPGAEKAGTPDDPDHGPGQYLWVPVGFFAAARQGRKDDAELGKGLWRRAHDRFHRGLDRYHQVLEGVEDDQLYDELVEIANDLAELSVRGQDQFASRRSDAHPVTAWISREHWQVSTGRCRKPATPWPPRRRRRRCCGWPSDPFR